MKNLILTIVTLFSLNSCSSKIDMNKVSKSSWMLSDWKGHTLAKNNLPTLQFDQNNKFNGKSFCNNYGGSLNITNEVIKIDDIYSTKMFCQDNSDLEAKYLSDLKLINRIKISKGAMRFYQDQQLIMTFLSPL